MTSQVRAQVDKFLTKHSNMIVPQGYISEMILPEHKSVQTTGLLGRYGNEHLRIVNSFTGGKGEYSIADTVSRASDSYAIEHHGLKSMVTPEDMANVELPFDAEKDKVETLTTMLWLQKEKALADVLGDNSIITQTQVPTVKYDNYSGTQELLQNVNDAQATIYDSVGAKPNTAIMSQKVATALRFNPDLLDSLGYKDNRPGGLNEAELARALDVDRVLIGGAVYNSAALGQADSLAPVWGPDLIFAVCPTNLALRQMTLGVRVQFAGRSPRQVFRSFVDEPVNSRKIIVVDDYDQVITRASAAYLLENVLT